MKQFKNFGAFAAHLEKLSISSGEVTHHIAEKSAEEIQKTAQGMIGDYQKAVGPYPEWEELADSTKKERARLDFSENDPGYRSGKMRDSISRKVEGAEAAVGSNDQDLVWFDLGTEKQSPRPVLGPAAIYSEGRVKRIIGGTIFAWLSGIGWRRPQRLK